ncbi:hypothetical protein [Dyadobacter koreensis]|uniref:hypothetical protein n=1 Tax=Dyadobacter koreensis TaxID=408657 RepID=UPI000B861781|nr:hypothetical protein [Dyadobacter koreensis]
MSNQSGGFLGFWYHGIEAEDGKIYIQIENTVNGNLDIENRIRVVLKISGWDQNLQRLYVNFEALRIIGLTNGLQLVKPNKFRVGATSTIAVLKNAFSNNEGEIFSMDDFLLILKRLEQTCDTFASNNLPKKIFTDLIE